MNKQNFGLTLIELLISLVLLSLIVVGFSNIDLFSRHHILNTDRQSKLQNEASYALELMTREIGNAIGNRAIGTINPISMVNVGQDRDIYITIDSNRDAQFSAGDIVRRFQWIGALGSVGVNERYKIRYYDGGGEFEVIANKISKFSVTSPAAENNVFVEITACWDPTEANFLCGTTDNPTFTARARIKMPSVSVATR